MGSFDVRIRMLTGTPKTRGWETERLLDATEDHAYRASTLSNRSSYAGVILKEGFQEVASLCKRYKQPTVSTTRSCLHLLLPQGKHLQVENGIPSTTIVEFTFAENESREAGGGEGSG
jgi:hypothetical protein